MSINYYEVNKMTKKTAKIFSLPLANRLKSLRKNHNLSRSTLAEMLDISQAYIAFLEQGIRQGSTETLKKYADYFNVSLEELIHLQQDNSLRVEQPSNSAIQQEYPQDIQELITALLKFEESSRKELINDFTSNVKQKLQNLLTPYALPEIKKLFMKIKEKWYSPMKQENEQFARDLNGSLQIPGKDLYFQLTCDDFSLRFTLLYEDRHNISVLEKWLGSYAVEVATETNIPHINETQKSICFIWFTPIVSVFQQNHYLEEKGYSLSELQCKDNQLSWFLRMKNLPNNSPDDEAS
jgi:transcriptional regulator with XRE-family HTH domain